MAIFPFLALVAAIPALVEGWMGLEGIGLLFERFDPSRELDVPTEPMPYFVDGHNLLGQTPGLSLTSPDDRRASRRRARRLLPRAAMPDDDLLRRRAPRRRPRRRASRRRPRRPLGRGRSADDLILETIRKARTPADIHLVTSDRALYERGRHLGAKGSSAIVSGR